jgi:hypothetical protein
MAGGRFEPGHVKLGGRKKGVRNVKIRAVEAAIAEAVAKSDPTNQEPKDFLLEIMRDKAYPLTTRMEAARIVSPFIHQRLEAKEIRAEVLGVQYAISDQPASDAEWLAEFCQPGSIAERADNVALKIAQLQNEELTREVDRLRDELNKAKQQTALAREDISRRIPLLS